MTYVLRDVTGTVGAKFVLLGLDNPNPPGGGGGPVDPPPPGPLPATPVPYGGSPGGQPPTTFIAARWELPDPDPSGFGLVATGVRVAEESAFEIWVRLSSAPTREVVIPIVRRPAPIASFSAAPESDLTCPTSVTFAPGQTLAVLQFTANDITPAGGQNERSVAVFLDSASATVPATATEGAIVVQPDLSFGDFGLYVHIVDAGVAVPHWLVPGPDAIAVPNGFGLIQPAITVQPEAVDELTFTVTLDGSSSAVAGVHVEIETPTVVIPAGGTLERAGIRVLTHGELVPSERVAVINFAKTAGTATQDPAETGQLEITIINTNQSTVVGFSSSGLVVSPGSPAVTVRGRVTGPVLAAPAIIEVVLSGSATSTDYQIEWLYQQNRALAPVGAGTSGEGTFDIARVTAGANANASSLVFAYGSILQQGTPAVTTTGSATVSILEAPPTDTWASVELATGRSENMVQGLVAVKPPSQTLPEFTLQNQTSGAATRAQTVGFAKNGDGLWTSCYVYGLITRDTFSAPDTGTPIKLAAVTSEADPGGSYAAPPAVALTFRPANTGVDFVGSTDGLDPLGTEALDLGNWTGPSASAKFGWEQAGADIVRESTFQCWLKETGDLTTNATVLGVSGFEDRRCGMVQGCIKQVRGWDVAFYSGCLHFGALDYQADWEDAGADNRGASGSAHWLNFSATAPAGFKFAIIDAHPGMVLSAGDTVLTFLPARATDYFSAAGTEYQFQFAVVPDPVGNVTVATAQAYLKRQNIATFIGNLGVDQNAIFGDTFDFQVNLQQGGISPSNVPFGVGAHANHWRRTQQASPIIAGELTQLFTPTAGAPPPYHAFVWGVARGWTSGCSDTTVIPGGNPDAVNSTVGWTIRRMGWMHPYSLGGIGQASGGMIDGGQGILPCAGWWRRADIHRMGIASRLRLAAADVRDQRVDHAEWIWNVARPTVAPQTSHAYCSPIIYHGISDQVFFRSPWFWSDQDATPSSIDTSLLSQYKRAPTSRPWNVHEVGADPDMAEMMANWTGYAMTHMSRVRNPIIDGWWGSREFMARRMYEQAAAMASRVFCPIPPRLAASNPGDTALYPQYLIKGFALTLDHSWFINENKIGASRNVNYVIRAGATGPGHAQRTYALDTLRKEAWGLALMMGFYATAQPTMRAKMAGGAPELNGVPVWAPLVSVLNHVMADSGWAFRVTGNSGNPSCYRSQDYGITNTAGNTGAWPDGIGRDWNAEWPAAGAPQAGLIRTGGLAYQVWYLTRSIFAYRYSQPAGSAAQTLLDRVWNLPGTIFRQARANVPGGKKDEIWQYYVGHGFSTASLDPISIPVQSMANLRNGAAWHQLSTGSANQNRSDNLEQLLAAMVLGIRALGDISDVDVMASVYDHPNWPVAFLEGGAIPVATVNQALAYMIGVEWSSQIRHINGAKLQNQYSGGVTWLTPVIAWFQRQLGA